MKFRKLKFKILAAALLFCALFIRIVPDYSASQGSCIVNIFSYYKYQKGYCLKENRILSNEELLQNAATNYFKRYHDYEVLRNTIIDEHDIKNFGHSFYTARISKLYLIGDFNEENWFDFLVENTDRKSFDYEIKDKTQIDISDLSKYFVYKDEILGFRKPIILSEEKNPLHGGKMFLEKSFLIKENQFFVNYARPGYISWYIELNNKEDLIKIKSKENLMAIKSGYESLENFNEVLAYTHMKHYRRKFSYDNCGNINFDIKVPVRQELDMWIHGG